MQPLTPEKLSAETFSAYGEIIETAGQDAVIINSGNCMRYHDLATLDMCHSGGAGISIFDATPYRNPLQINHLERHPLGSQAFLPINDNPYLVTVAEDANGIPANLRVFVSQGYQGVNYRRNTWHGVLTPIVARSKFIVVDYIGDHKNLEEYWFEQPYQVDFSSWIEHV